MCTPPPGYRADEREIAAFYTAVAAATDLPLMVYNNPSVTHNDMPPRLIAELGGVDTVWAVKETSGDCRRIAEILDLTDGVMEVLVGGDDWALEGVAAGATGGLPAAAWSSRGERRPVRRLHRREVRPGEADLPVSAAAGQAGHGAEAGAVLQGGAG